MALPRPGERLASKIGCSPSVAPRGAVTASNIWQDSRWQPADDTSGQEHSQATAQSAAKLFSDGVLTVPATASASKYHRLQGSSSDDSWWQGMAVATATATSAMLLIQCKSRVRARHTRACAQWARMQAAARQCAVKSEAHKAADTIQAGARGLLARKLANWIVLSAIVRLQSAARGLLVRSALRFVAAAYIIQLAMRAFIKHRITSLLYAPCEALGRYSFVRSGFPYNIQARPTAATDDAGAAGSTPSATKKKASSAKKARARKDRAQRAEATSARNRLLPFHAQRRAFGVDPEPEENWFYDADAAALGMLGLSANRELVWPAWVGRYCGLSGPPTQFLMCGNTVDDDQLASDSALYDVEDHIRACCLDFAEAEIVQIVFPRAGPLLYLCYIEFAQVEGAARAIMWFHEIIDNVEVCFFPGMPKLDAANGIGESPCAHDKTRAGAIPTDLADHAPPSLVGSVASRG